MKTLVGLEKMAFDAYKGVPSAEFSKQDMNEAIRTAVREACGGDWNYYNFMKNRYDVFALISQVMPVAMNASLSNKFGQFADFKDTAVGDLNYFTVEDNQLYPIYTTSRGNMDIERVKIIDNNFSVPTTMKMIKFYDEWDLFMAGKIDFARLTDRAAISMENYVGTLVSDSIYGSYASVDTPYKATGAFDASTLVDIIANVKAATGNDAIQIWGDTSALANVADGFGYSDAMKDGANSLGYYDSFRGTPMFAMPQAYTAQTQTFAVNRSHIVVVPANEKIVKVVFEGETLVNATDGMGRNDMQPEFVFGRRVGAAAITAQIGKFGFYKFS